jgi:hypothetical protein
MSSMRGVSREQALAAKKIACELIFKRFQSAWGISISPISVSNGGTEYVLQVRFQGAIPPEAIQEFSYINGVPVTFASVALESP